MARWARWASVVIFLTAGVGAEDGNREPEAFFPIMAWDWIRETDMLPDLAACGFTIGGFCAPGLLDAASAAGLRMIVADPRARRYDWTDVNAAEARANIEALAGEVGRHPAAFAFALRDEPSRADFEGLALVSDLVRSFAPGIPPFINLFPNYASPGQLGERSYRAYVERFVEICRPEILCYDHYAPMEDGTLRESYWSNLEVIRQVARDRDIPFWNVVLSAAHFNYREVTAADLRFQVFSTLAYGGRGIVYFKYQAPARGNYRMAPLDQFGHRTRTWYDLQNVNFQVRRLAPVLLALSSDAVYHFGDLPPGTRGPPGDSLVVEAGPHFAVGDFTHADGTRYVMLVNRDLYRSHRCMPVFRSPPAQVWLVSAFTDRRLRFEGEQVWFAPGQGMLLKLEP